MGSIVFTGGPFEVELDARPITILSPCFALDKVKIESKLVYKTGKKFFVIDGLKF